ncbi:PQQ-binding-like beta-propeller repeat protein [Euzebya rosea]|uniref:outer membrane protein assembly factor BamB family protein n=1 Tax=Euzebya rosea TaxID=2052804 RepID=UPI001473F5FC|nr:PQQ-binding-like beta-propeller repeat protein [Euzebya rosea]
MNCDGCQRPMAEGATTCASCGHDHRTPARARETIVFRPDQLGLPGQLPPGLPDAQPVPQLPPPPPGRTRGWAWGLLAVGLVAALGVVGALLLLRADTDPDVAVGAATATSPITATPPGSPAPDATATQAEAATGAATTEPTAAEPGSTEPSPTEPGPTELASSEPASADAATPVDQPAFVPREEGFLLFDSGDRERLPAPVGSTPTPAWTAALPGEVVGVDGDEDLLVVTVSTDAGDRLEALDVTTGEPRWSSPLVGDGTTPVATSVVIAEAVVVILRTEDADALVVGLDRETGKEVWSTTTTDDGDLFPVVLADGRVLISDVGRIDHLDPQTGELTTLLSGELLRLGPDAIAAFTDGTVRMVDLDDGTPRYDLFVGPIGDDGDFAFTDDRVVVFDGETVWSISTTGQREWDFNPTDPAPRLRRMVLLPDDLLLASFDGVDGTVALDIATGEERWRSPVPVDLTGTFDGALRGIGGDTDIQLVDLLDGSDVTSLPDSGGAGSPYANGLYYALTDDGLTANRLVDGQPLWSVEADDLEDRHAIPGAIVVTDTGDAVTLLR